MEPITAKLKRTRLFANLPDEAIVALIERPGIATGAAGDPVDARQGDLVVLLEGGLAMGSDDGGAHVAAFSVDEGARDPAILYTIPAGARLQLSRPSVYLVVEGERLDAVLAGRQQEKSLATLDESVRERVAGLVRARPFERLSLEQIVACAEVMEAMEVEPGEEIVREGEPGDYFYVIETGSAEVVRAGADGGASVLARLGPGAGFGEEALLKGEPRNATVRMTAAGRVLRLAKGDFQRLLERRLLEEIPPEEARRRVDLRGAALIDCRYEEEWELSRLRGARLVPLDQIRERLRGLDPRREYIVYCRTGRRSRAAAFLMRQAGLDAVALAGGIVRWPYELESGEA